MLELLVFVLLVTGTMIAVGVIPIVLGIRALTRHPYDVNRGAIVSIVFGSILLGGVLLGAGWLLNELGRGLASP